MFSDYGEISPSCPDSVKGERRTDRLRYVGVGFTLGLVVEERFACIVRYGQKVGRPERTVNFERCGRILQDSLLVHTHDSGWLRKSLVRGGQGICNARRTM